MMVKKRIVLTKQEYRQLSQILNAMKSNHRLNQPHLISLYEEVGDAVIMERDGFSSGYVTLPLGHFLGQFVECVDLIRI